MSVEHGPHGWTCAGMPDNLGWVAVEPMEGCQGFMAHACVHLTDSSEWRSPHIIESGVGATPERAVDAALDRLGESMGHAMGRMLRAERELGGAVDELLGELGGGE